MVITAVVDRIEDGNAILLSQDFGIEICIPADNVKETINQGDVLTLFIDEKGEISSLKNR